MSTYVYGRDNPLLFTDPSGESIRGNLRTVAGTVKEVPGTIRTAFSSPGDFATFVGSVAAYGTGGALLRYGIPWGWRTCMSTPTRVLDAWAKIDHPVSCMFHSGFVGGTSGGPFLIGGILSRRLADEELGRSTK